MPYWVLREYLFKCEIYGWVKSWDSLKACYKTIKHRRLWNK